MIFDPSFHKNQLYHYSICVLYIFPFLLYYVLGDERSNTIEKFHAFLQTKASHGISLEKQAGYLKQETQKIFPLKLIKLLKNSIIKKFGILEK